MSIPQSLLHHLISLAERVSAAREPDIVIGGHDNPYLRRWWVLPRNRIFNIYLHHLMRSDDDRALHDHPWINCSILITGEYDEHTIAKGGINHRQRLTAGQIKFRGPRFAHRVELVSGPCWTLFLTGPTVRNWGFHCPHGWRHWRDFTAGKNGETIGRGCD